MICMAGENRSTFAIENVQRATEAGEMKLRHLLIFVALFCVENLKWLF